MGIAEQILHRWKRKFGGIGFAEVRRLKVLEQQNKKLKQMVADPSLDKQIFQNVLQKSLEACSNAEIPRGPAALLRSKQAEDMPGIAMSEIYL